MRARSTEKRNNAPSLLYFVLSSTTTSPWFAFMVPGLDPCTLRCVYFLEEPSSSQCYFRMFVGILVICSFSSPHTPFWRAVVNLYSSSSPSVFLAFLCSNAIVIVSSASHFVTSFLLVFVTFLSAFTILRMPSNSSSGSLSDNRSRHEKVMGTSAVGSRKRWNPSYRTSPFCYTHYAIDLVQGGILG